MGLIQEAAPLITVGNGQGVSPRPSAPLWIWSFSAEPFCVEASLLMPVALFPQQIQPGCIFFFLEDELGWLTGAWCLCL